MATVKVNDIVQVAYGNGDSDSCGTAPQTPDEPPDDLPPTGVIFADYFDAVHDPWNPAGWIHADHWDETADTAAQMSGHGFYFGNSSDSLDDGTAAMQWSLDAGCADSVVNKVERTFGPSEFPLMRPNTLYSITFRARYNANGNFYGSRVGFKGNGTEISLAHTQGVDVVAWQTVTGQWLSDVNGEIHVEAGMILIHVHGFIIQGYYYLDSLVGSYP